MINQKRIQELLNSSFFGKYLFILSEVDSTNTFAKHKAQEGAPEGTAVITDFQTAGRGRQGRIWQSDPGKNLLMSLILRPRLQARSVRCLTLAMATVLVKTLEVFIKIEQANPPPIEVKWPNDVLVDGKKIAGILTESSIRDQYFDYIIIGIGLNVNQEVDKLDDEVSAKATSLLEITGVQFERERLIAHILTNFEKYYIQLERSNYSNIVSDWKNYWKMKGLRVQIETPLLTEWGELIEVNSHGYLLYKTDDGLEKELIAGNILQE